MKAETQLFYISVTGLALAILGLLWLITAAFRVRKLWGLAVVVFLPVALPIFVIRYFKASIRPLIVMAVGLAVGSGPILYNRFTPIDLGPLERKVGDELHITLTGWDRHDYSILAERPDVVVLQMANPDVTDQTLAYLQGKSRLRELDLNGTQVGDEGLRDLNDLPALETLRLRGTKITDAGFQKWLVPVASLRQLDLRGTSVTKESGQAWKAAEPGRKLLQ